MDYEKVFKNKFQVQLGEHYKCRDGSIIKVKLVAHSESEEGVDYVVYSKNGEMWTTEYDGFFEVYRKYLTGKAELRVVDLDRTTVVDGLSFSVCGMIVDITQLVNLVSIKLYDGQNCMTFNLSKELSAQIINKELEIYPEQFVEIVGITNLDDKSVAINKQQLFICELAHELIK